MHKITVSQLKDFLRHIVIRLDEPAFVWGVMGGGKTQASAQLAVEDGLFHVDIRLSQYDTVDLRGVPGRDETTGLTVWYPPATLPFVGNDLFPDDKTILLTLDEMNTAPPSVQAVAYQLVNERRVGEHVLKPNVRIVAMGNREGDRGVTSKQPAPLSNRFTHVELVPDRDAFVAYAGDVGLPQECVGFYHFKPDLLCTFDPLKAEKAFATPRSSEKAWRYYADPDLPLEVKRAAMAGAVGEGVATEMWAFVAVWQDVMKLMPEVLKNPTTARLPQELSMRYAMTTYLVGLVVDAAKKGKLAATLGPADTYLRRMDADFQVLFWSLCVNRDGRIGSTPQFRAFAKENTFFAR